MGSAAEQIQSSLDTVQRTLDLLTSRGHHEQAFDLARAQFSASLRSSWPGNLGALSQRLLLVAEDKSLDLASDERSEIAQAALILRDLCNQ